MSENLHALLARACFGREPVFESDLEAFLGAHGVAAEDADVVRAAKKRLAIYRRLVRHNVLTIIDTMLEQTRMRLEARVPGEMDKTAAMFLDEVGPRTAHLRDVPSEFLAYAAPRWRDDARLPRWIVDHAELELSEFTIGVAPRPLPPPPLGEVTADRPLVFGEPKRIVHLGWAVHTMPRGDAHAEPEARAVSILVYRDPQHQSRFLELSPLAAAILERLFAGDPLAQAIGAACAAKEHPLDDAVLAGAAHLLADLGERGVLLGAAVDAAP
jgi:hypothetical protein